MEVSLHVANSEAVVAAVRRGEVDVGFIESPSVSGDLASRRVASDPLVVVIAPEHPWARRRKPVHVDEIAATRLVVREPGSGTRTALERALDAERMAKPLLELSPNAAVKVAVERGIAPAVLSVLAVTGEIRDGRLVDVPVEDLQLGRPLRALWQRGRRLTDAAATLVRLAEASSRQHMSPGDGRPPGSRSPA